MSSAAPSSFTMSFADKQKTLLRRYVDLAYVNDDLIMRSVATSTAGGGIGLDIATLGLFSPFKTLVQAPTMGGVRAKRRSQARQLYAAINAMNAQQVASAVNALHSELGANQTPSWSQLERHVTPAAGGADSKTALAAAAAGAGAAAASVASTAGMAVAEVFVDTVSDAAMDAALEAIPFAGGAIGASKNGALVGVLTARKIKLEREITELWAQGAAPKSSGDGKDTKGG
ncbi:Hypothetical protein A7982_00281 [Minicystis rosea]|nr:Hypothetical protein A7982_00281 [Minicystis rosea]